VSVLTVDFRRTNYFASMFVSFYNFTLGHELDEVPYSISYGIPVAVSDRPFIHTYTIVYIVTIVDWAYIEY